MITALRISVYNGYYLHSRERSGELIEEVTLDAIVSIEMNLLFLLNLEVKKPDILKPMSHSMRYARLLCIFLIGMLTLSFDLLLYMPNIGCIDSYRILALLSIDLIHNDVMSSLHGMYPGSCSQQCQVSKLVTLQPFILTSYSNYMEDISCCLSANQSLSVFNTLAQAL